MIADQSAIGCQENYIDNHFFGGWFSEVFGGRQMIVDDRRPVGDWLSEQFGRREVFVCSIENQTSRRHFCKHSLVGDRSPINRRSVADPVFSGCPSFFLVSNNKTATKWNAPSPRLSITCMFPYNGQFVPLLSLYW